VLQSLCSLSLVTRNVVETAVQALIKSSNEMVFFHSKFTMLSSKLWEKPLISLLLIILMMVVVSQISLDHINSRNIGSIQQVV